MRALDHIPAIFKTFSKDNPNPTGDLTYSSPFELLIAVVLSAQATDISVNKATDKLFKVANTPELIYALGEDGLKVYIRHIGLYNSKAQHVVGLCKILMDEFDSTVPNDLDLLTSLPGVGRKTANVVLNIAFSQPTIAVDTHVFRVSRRLGLTAANTVLGVELDLYRVIPQEYLMHAHLWFILHGRYVCKSRKPLCEQCSLTQYCQYYFEKSVSFYLQKVFRFCMMK